MCASAFHLALLNFKINRNVIWFKLNSIARNLTSSLPYVRWLTRTCAKLSFSVRIPRDLLCECALKHWTLKGEEFGWTVR